MSRYNISRRSFIKMAVVGAGFSGSIFYGVQTLNTQSFIISTLESTLGNFNIREEDMLKFCNHFTEQYGEKKLLKLIVLDQASAFGLVGGERAIRLDKYERKVVTDFLVSTNYFQVVDPSTDLLEYYGPSLYCYNQLARFDFS